MRILFLSILFFLHYFSIAQSFSGQWKGSFVDKSTSMYNWGGEECEYVLELDVQGNQASGSSYTYFSDNGKRYYTICKLIGKVNKKLKYIEITETKRIKTNVPVTIRNCFQLHTLNYAKSSDGESLTGTWKPAPNQNGDCGYGTTLLKKRSMLSTYPNFNSKAILKDNKKESIAAKYKPESSKIEIAKIQPSKIKKEEPIKNMQPEKLVVAEAVKPVTAPASVIPNREVKVPELQTNIQAPVTFETRTANLLKSIMIDHDEISVQFFDNGVIDGDSISIFFNQKLILSKQRLSEKPIALTLHVLPGENELLMYAENLGTIAPNTALMIVRDGDKKYEIGMSSDLNKSGAIRLIKK